MTYHTNRLSLLLCVLIFYVSNGFALPSNVTLLSDIAYGQDKDQTLDVYRPANLTDAPVIFMVHGGAWRIGDKAARSVVRNKVRHWVTKGFIFISINYRMLPAVHPVEQAKDVKAALRFSQQHSHQWGGSADKFILMGHSAGAHLVSLLSSSHRPALENNIIPWLGTIAIDSAAYDVVKIMRSPNHRRFHKKAFGHELQYWKEASPLYSLTNKIPPFLAICSQQRKDGACAQAQRFIKKADGLGSNAQLMAVDLSHRETNTKLGKNPCYTNSVDDFLKRLHPSIQVMLSNQEAQYRRDCSRS